MKFTNTGNFEGDAEIFITGKSLGTTYVSRTVPVTYAIEETLLE